MKLCVRPLPSWVVGLSFLECFLTFPLPLCGFGRLLLYRPFGLGIFKFLPHSCEVASGDELGKARCHRFPTILCAVVGGEEI